MLVRGQRDSDDALDELGLSTGVRFARRVIVRMDFRHQPFLQPLVFTSDARVAAQVVAKRKRSSLFFASGPDDMHVVRVRPLARPVKERAEPIVRVRNVDVAERFERVAVRIERAEIDH